MLNKIDELSKELYKLSREKSFLNKELEYYNKKDIDNGILLAINQVKKIDDKDNFSGIEFVSKKFNNGLNVDLALFDFDDKKIALNIDSKYVIKNYDYFENHHSFIKYDEIKETNKEINELRNNPYIFDLNISGSDVSYSQKEVRVSKKQSLLHSSEFVDLFQKINKIHESNDSMFQKYFELKNLITEKEAKIKEIKNILIKSNFENDFVETCIIPKQKEIEIDFDDNINAQINRKVNSHATVEALLEQGKYVLPETYEKKVSIKLFMIGTREEIDKKLKNLIRDVNKKDKEKEEDFQKSLEENITVRKEPEFFYGFS